MATNFYNSAFLIFFRNSVSPYQIRRLVIESI